MIDNSEYQVKFFSEEMLSKSIDYNFSTSDYARNEWVRRWSAEYPMMQTPNGLRKYGCWVEW